MEFYPIRLGLTLGIIWGSSMLILAFLHNKTYGSVLFGMMSNLYLGCHRDNILGKLTCGLLAFLDAFFGGFIFAHLYNYLPLKR